eukprot:NODE_23_length_38171_cov_0.318108.p21 type:complete len:106 gc:universal NODE_23_length_38171_cov_0.318108:28773-28456(-)
MEEQFNELQSLIDGTNWWDMKMTDPVAFNTLNSRLLTAINRILKNENFPKSLPVDIVDRIIQPRVQQLVNIARPPKTTLADLEDYIKESKAEEEDLVKILQELIK